MLLLILEPDGYFQIAPECIGLSRDQEQQIRTGELPIDQHAGAMNALQEELFKLYETPTQGNC